MTVAEVREALDQVLDPELGLSVVELGLVYGIEVEDGEVRVRLTMTSPTCPMGELLVAEAERTIRRRLPGVRAVRVELVWEPPWAPSMMSAAARARLGWT